MQVSVLGPSHLDSAARTWVEPRNHHKPQVGGRGLIPARLRLNIEITVRGDGRPPTLNRLGIADHQPA